MKIIIGSDHRGYKLKEKIKEYFANIDWQDVGTTNGDDRVDYPVFTKKTCELIISGESDRAILICGSGVGVSIAANRFSGIYAALCWSPEVAKVAREHDCANILALSADFINIETSIKIVNTWLEAKFEGGRYKERLQMLDKIKK